MDGSNFFLTGANGQLGRALRQKYGNIKHANINQLNICYEESINDYDWSNVDVIFNAAAYTNVDNAETEEGRVAAWEVNAKGVANLVKIARAHGITLVHFSSDYVFDGRQAPHKETEAFSPLGVYGQSKAAGDLIISTLPKHYVLRTSWVIGDGNNFVRTMLSLGEKGINPKIVSDQTGRLTFTNELARIAEHLISSNAPNGVYNASNSGDVVSWSNITREIFKLKNYKLEVTDITTNEYFAGKDRIAPRPLRSELDLSKLKSTGFDSADWQDDLIEYIRKEKS
jgi:dTDP-4-dehydrorhamnose reductase